LVTDLLAFLVIVVFAVKAGFMNPKFRGPRIIRAIVQDATVYFLFIFTSHFVFEMTLLFARVGTFIVNNDSVGLIISLAESTTIAGEVSIEFLPQWTPTQHVLSYLDE
jgi:hypothetical protein